MLQTYLLKSKRALPSPSRRLKRNKNNIKEQKAKKERHHRRSCVHYFSRIFRQQLRATEWENDFQDKQNWIKKFLDFSRRVRQKQCWYFLCVCVCCLFVCLVLKNGRNRIKVGWNQMGKINDTSTTKRSHKAITFTFYESFVNEHDDISKHTMAHKLDQEEKSTMRLCFFLFPISLALFSRIFSLSSSTSDKKPNKI